MVSVADAIEEALASELIPTRMRLTVKINDSYITIIMHRDLISVTTLFIQTTTEKYIITIDIGRNTFTGRIEGEINVYVSGEGTKKVKMIRFSEDDYIRFLLNIINVIRARR